MCKFTRLRQSSGHHSRQLRDLLMQQLLEITFNQIFSLYQNCDILQIFIDKEKEYQKILKIIELCETAIYDKIDNIRNNDTAEKIKEIKTYCLLRVQHKDATAELYQQIINEDRNYDQTNQNHPA